MTLTSEIAALADQYGHDRTALFPILHAVQDKYGCISNEAVAEIGAQLNVFPVEIQGVITFYHFFTQKPQGKVTAYVANCLPCKMKGSDNLLKTLKEKYATNPDVTIAETSCMGMCDQAPAMLINNMPYTNLTAEKVVEIIDQLAS